MKTARMVVFLFVVMVMFGCATTMERQVANTMDDLATETTAVPTATGTNPLIEALNKFENNPIFTLAAADSKRTLEKVDTWVGKIPDSDIFDASACPTRILLALDGLHVRIEKYKAFITGMESMLGGATDGEFTGIILPLTIRKWGPKGEVGSDQKAEFQALKESILKDVRGVQRACANVIPDRDLIRLGREALSAGLK